MNCVFCDISKNNTEEYRIIYSDESYIAMLVSHPETSGHFIVFPKKHFSEMKGMKDSASFFELAVKLAEEKTQLLKAKAYTLKLNNNVFKLDKDPLHVGHVHIHIVPRYQDIDFGKEKPNKADRQYFVALKKIMFT